MLELVARRPAPYIGHSLDTPKAVPVPRTVRDAKLESRTARTHLKVSRKPYYRAIDPGLHLGYRKGASGGRWVARLYVGNGRYRVRAIDGVADDKQDADGCVVLSFAQAQEKARQLFVAANAPPGSKRSALTVKEACEAYIEYLRAERKSARDAEQRLVKRVYPKLGDRLVIELTTSEIEKCKRAMVRRAKDDPEVERRSKASANRIMSSLRAALNRAFQDESNNIPSDAAWRRVKQFREVVRPRQVHLDVAQANRLINVCSGAFRRLVTAALLTGAWPPHELTCRVRDFRADLGTLSVDGKTGPRDIVLTREGVRYLEEIAAGREPDELLLPKDDGTSWGKNHHIRPMREAVAKAKLPKDCTMYALRHTYASQSLLAGMNLQLLAENMGTSIRMIEVHYGKFIAASRRKLVEESAFKLGLQAEKVTQLRPRLRSTATPP